MTSAVPEPLDTAAVLTATDRLLRTLAGPLGGSATWEWGDLLAAATGRSPFDMMPTVRAARPSVPDPKAAQPVEVAAELRRMAAMLDAAGEQDGDRVRRVAHLLDPRGHDDASRQPRPAGVPEPTPAPSPAAPTAARPAESATPAPTVLPAPHAAPPPTPARPGQPGRPGRGNRSKRRRAAIPWLVIVIGFLVLRGCFGDVFDEASGPGAPGPEPSSELVTSPHAAGW